MSSDYILSNGATSYEEVREFANSNQYANCPVGAVCDIENWNESFPLRIFKVIRKKYPKSFIFESLDSRDGKDKQNRCRWTFVGLGDSKNLSSLEFDSDSVDYSKVIAKYLEQQRSPTIEGLPPFTGGLVGYFAWESYGNREKKVRKAFNQWTAENQSGFSDFDLEFFRSVVAIDNIEKKLWIIRQVDLTANNIEEEYNSAISLIDEAYSLVADGEEFGFERLQLKSGVSEKFNETEYSEVVDKVKRHIAEGDIFQAVVANKLSWKAEGNLFDTYGVLRRTNPSPYMFYFAGSEVEIAGAAPETLVSVDAEGVIATYPLAGTRPRGKTEAEDLELETELLADEKELAEHNMLVDLGRNDLSEFAEYGSVEVSEYLNVLKFSHVQHLGSKVVAKCRGGLAESIASALNVLPAGTLSGAPKIRAVEIISELEGEERGVYGGAVGYIGCDGALDFCITIRSAFKVGDKVWTEAGAGIVQDSNPLSEYQETHHKMAAVKNAILIASGGSENG